MQHTGTHWQLLKTKGQAVLGGGELLTDEGALYLHVVAKSSGHQKRENGGGVKVLIKSLLNRIAVMWGGYRGGAGLWSRGCPSWSAYPSCLVFAYYGPMAETAHASPKGPPASTASGNAPALAVGRRGRPPSRSAQLWGRQTPAPAPTTADKAKYPITEGESGTAAHKYTVFVNYY